MNRLNWKLKRQSCKTQNIPVFLKVHGFKRWAGIDKVSYNDTDWDAFYLNIYLRQIGNTCREIDFKIIVVSTIHQRDVIIARWSFMANHLPNQITTWSFTFDFVELANLHNVMYLHVHKKRESCVCYLIMYMLIRHSTLIYKMQKHCKHLAALKTQELRSHTAEK